MKKVLLVVLSLVGMILVAGIFAPKDFIVEREVVINKPKDLVFSYVKFLKNGDSWNPWSKRDPNIKKDYQGTDGTVGFVSSWAGNKEVGVGEQEIKNIVEGEKIESELRFKEPIKDTSFSYLVTESVGEGQTRVKWGMMGKTRFPFNIVCFIMNMPKKLGHDFDEGLNTLKQILEK